LEQRFESASPRILARLLQGTGRVLQQRVKGVIFDVDGTLVNSNDAHAQAWLEALRSRNIDVPLSVIRNAIGMGGDKLLPRVARVDADSQLGQELSQRRGEIFRTQFLPTLRAFAQARNLLLALRAMGLKLGVASSAQKAELGALLDVAQVSDLLEAAASSGDAEHSKPDPDIVGAALRRLDLSAGHALLIGDTPYDVEAAARAGVSSIALRCGGRSDRDLAGALAIYDDPADLLAHLQTSPIRRGVEA
jgi:HAD superfamily hydrolase (TIGR01509 family)